MNNQEKILKYLDGGMNDQEAQAFKTELNSNPELKSEFENFNELVSAVKLNERKKLKNRITKITNQELSTHTKVIKMNTQKKQWPRWTAFAAGLFIALGVTLFMNQGSTDPKQLFADNYKAQTDVTNTYLDKIGSAGFSTPIGDSLMAMPNGDTLSMQDFLAREQQRTSTLTSGLTQFKKSNWKDARIALATYKEGYVYPQEDYQIALFHLGKAMLNEGDYAGAADVYNQFLSEAKMDKEVMEVAEFDRAIVYLQIDPEKAKQHLDVIAKNNAHTYQDTAKGLYDSL